MLLAVTHSGKIHSVDDVLSWSLLQYFCPQTYTLTRPEMKMCLHKQISFLTSVEFLIQKQQI